MTCSYEEREWTFINQAEGSPSTVALPSVASGASQRSLARTDTALQTDAQFWQMYLPHEEPALDGSVGGVLSAPWIPTVRAIAVVKSALQACAFAGLGWMQNDSSMLQHATGLYVQALKTTNQALQDPVQVQRDEVLACCGLLSLFELFCRSSGSAATGPNQLSDWRRHVDGTCRIVRLRGPERHMTGHGLQLYDGVRMTAIINGLATRKPNSFTTLRWNMPKWNLRDELFDLASDIPSLLEQIDDIGTELDTSEVLRDADDALCRIQALIETCLVMCNALRAWETKALNLCLGRQFAYRYGSHDVDRRGFSPFNVCMRHGDGFFFICTQYWAMCITLYSSIQGLHERLLSHVDTPSLEGQTPPLPGWIEADPFALNIAHVSSHFFRPQAGLWYVQPAFFPLVTALTFLARTGRRTSEPFKTITDAFDNCKEGAFLREFVHNVFSR